MNGKSRRNRAVRLWGMGALFLAVCLIYVIRMGALELSPANILGHKQDGTTRRTVVVQAVRGQIYDRNGVRYLFSDFKKKNGYKRSCELSEIHGLYRQDYCGCEFSRIQRDNKNNH